MATAATALALEQIRERFGASPFRERPERQAPPRWGWAALSGRLAELSAPAGAAALSWAMALVRDAQAAGETTVWVMGSGSAWYPPDAAAWGIDLEALAVVRAPEPAAGARAAERLARSGAFGLIVLELGAGAALSAALQSRFAQHALHHACAVLCLTEKPAGAPSLGSLVSLRAQAGRRRRPEGGFACTLHIAKDKRNGPGWGQEEGCDGPPGLR